MQRPTRILIATSVFLFAMMIISFLLPDFWQVRRSIVIEARAGTIFPFLNDPRKWREWMLVYQQQAPHPIEYSGPASGIGATSRWNDEYGANVMKIMETEKNYSINYQILFQAGMARTEGRFLLLPADAATRVVWEAGGGNIHGPMNRYYALFLRIRMGKDFDASLQRLKQKIESKS